MSQVPFRLSEKIECAIFEWADKNSGPDTLVIWDKPNAPRPELPLIKKPYISLNLLTGFVRVGGADEIRRVPNSDDQDVGGPRTLSLSIVVYGMEAFRIASTLQLSLGKDLVREKLRKDSNRGLAVQNEGDVQDASALLETGFETRATFDVIFNSKDSMAETVPTIGTTEIKGDVVDPSGTDELDFTTTEP